MKEENLAIDALTLAQILAKPTLSTTSENFVGKY